MKSDKYAMILQNKSSFILTVYTDQDMRIRIFIMFYHVPNFKYNKYS